MNDKNEMLIYQSKDGQIKVDVRLDNETVWLTQGQMCDLFGKSKSTISEHLKNIFEEGELELSSVVRDFRTTASDGKDYITKHYNLDVIISVGYRVKSMQGTQFRIWATQRLKEYIIYIVCKTAIHRQQKGYADDGNKLLSAQIFAFNTQPASA